MEQELIDKINALCPEDQGIFIEPFGCDGITEPLIYMRWITGGENGGGYHENDYRHWFDGDNKPSFFVLDLVLQELASNLTYIQIEKIQKLNYSSDEDEYPDYYGNYNAYGIEYIKLSDLEQLLKTFEL